MFARGATIFLDGLCLEYGHEKPVITPLLTSPIFSLACAYHFPRIVYAAAILFYQRDKKMERFDYETVSLLANHGLDRPAVSYSIG